MPTSDKELTAESTTDWESRIGELISRLSEVQSELLAHLDAKRRALLDGDRDVLMRSATSEQQLTARLQQCQQERQDLLNEAAAAGLPGASLGDLAQRVAVRDRAGVVGAIEQARNRSRLLQHQSLTNWVAVQRTLLHLSQLIELVATGGDKRPTYEKTGHSAASGALVDRAV